MSVQVAVQPTVVMGFQALVLCVALLRVGCYASSPRYAVTEGWKLGSNPFSKSGNFSSVTSVGWDTVNSRLIVAQRTTPPLLAVDGQTGKVLCELSAPWLNTPHGLFASPFHLSQFWVTDVGNHSALEFSVDGCSTTLLRTLGTPPTAGPGLDPLQFDEVADAATSSSGVVFLSDGDGGSNARVSAVTPAGNRLWTVGRNGTGAHDMISPHTVAFHSSSGLLFVGDRGNARLDVYSSYGVYIGEWTCMSAAPWGIRIDDARGVLLMVDATVGDLFVLDLSHVTPSSLGDCNVLQTLHVADPSVKTHELTIDRHSGDVYIADVGVPTGVNKLHLV